MGLSRGSAASPGPRVGESRAVLTDARAVLVLARSATKAGELVDALQRQGVPALMATKARQALHWVKEVSPALVLMDLGAEGAPILLRELRREGHQIVALSDESAARQTALEAGCLEAHHCSDSPAEVALNVAALLRDRDVKPVGLVVAGRLEVDASCGRLKFRDRELVVSPLILRLAAHLAAKAGRFVSARALLREVWGEPWADPAKVHVAVLRLRRSLGLSADSKLLVARRGHGYGFFPDAERVGRAQVLHP